MLSSFSTFQSLDNYAITSFAPSGPPTITFTSGTAESGTYNGFTYRKFANTGDYSFTMTNFQGKTIYFIVLGGGSGGQQGFISSQRGGSGGSGGQCVYGSYVVSSSSFNCTARVGMGGIGSYYGNGNRSTGGTVPVGGGDDIGVLYGTTTTNDPETSVATGQVKCSGGYSELVGGGEWGTIKALGGLAGDQNTYQILNTCPSTGFLLGTNTTATFVQGKTGGRGNFGITVGENGITGEPVSFAGYITRLGSSAGGASGDQNTQTTSGSNAGRASGSLGSYTGHSNPNATDGYPGTNTYGSGGGGGSGSGGVPYNASNVNYARQKGGNGGSGVIFIWWA